MRQLLSDETNPCDCSQKNGSKEIPDNVGLDTSALHSADFEGAPLCECCEAVHCAVNHMAVEPCYRAADVGEDDSMSNVLIDLIPVEAAVGSSPESRPDVLDTCGPGILFVIHHICQSDCKQCDHDRGDSHRSLEMDMIGLAIIRYEFTEWNEAGHTGDGGEDNQRH